MRLTKTLICLLFLLSCNMAYAGKELAAEYYEKALLEFNRASYKEAVIYLKNAIQQDTNYLAAYILLGKAHLKVGDGAAAEKELLRADRLGADKNLTMKAYADALLIQNKYDEVIRKIPASGLNKELQSYLLTQRGDAYLDMRDLTNANLSYQEAKFLKPNYARPYLGMAAANIRQGKLDQAEENISRALDFDNQSAQAWQLKASIRHAQSNFDKAIQFYDKALKSEQHHLAALLGRASALYDSLKLKDALIDINKLGEKYPLEPRVSYLKYSILKTQDNNTAAKQALESTQTLLARIPEESLHNHAAMLLLAGVTNYELKQFEKAHQYLKIYLRKFQSNAYVEKLMGSILLARGEYQEAVRLLESALKTQPNDYQLLTLLGTAYTNIRLYSNAKDTLEKAIALQENAGSARLQKAINELNFGERKSASKELETLFEKSADARIGLMLATLYFKQHDNKKAQIITQNIVDKNPDNLIARNLLGVAQMANNDLKNARENFQTILNQEVDHFPAQMNLVKLDFTEGNLDAADKRLQQLTKNNQNMSTVLLAKSQLALAKKDVKESLRWAEKAHDADKNNISAILHLAESYLRTNQAEKALQTTESANLKFSENFQIMSLLGRSYQATGSPKLAHSVYREMAKLASYNSRQLYHIARLQNKAQDNEGSLWSLQKAVDGDPDFTPARVALVESLIALNELTQAHLQIEALKNDAQPALYYRLNADLHRSQKQYKKAIHWYELAIKENTDSDTVIRLFQSYAANQQLNKGISLLEQSLKQQKNNSALQTELADAYLHTGKTKKAQKLYEKLIKHNANHAHALNNLANIYHEMGNKNAIDMARKAQQLAPDNVAFNDTLGWILVTNGQPAEGLSHLRNAFARAATSGEIRYHIAMALHQLKRDDEARKELKYLHEHKELRFPSRPQAEALYKRLN